MVTLMDVHQGKVFNQPYKNVPVRPEQPKIVEEAEVTRLSDLKLLVITPWI